jgi:hypothetical protein
MATQRGVELVESVIKCHAEDFEALFDDFAQQHSKAFIGAGTLHGDEHNHEAMDLFHEFAGLLDDKLEAILRDQDASMSELLDACEHELKHNGNNKWAVELLLATAEYERFFVLMANAAKLEQLTSDKK